MFKVKIDKEWFVVPSLSIEKELKNDFRKDGFVVEDE